MGTLRRTCAENCLALGLLLAGLPALAATPRLPATLPTGTGRAKSDDPAARDWLLAYRARQTLTQDPALNALNLGVSIRSGAIVLWGFVPSAELGRRAEKRVRALPGVTQVHSDLQVLGPDDLLTDILNREPPLFPAPLVSLPEALQLPAQLTSRRADGSAPPPEKGPGVALMPPLLAPATLPAETRRPIKPAESLAAMVERLRSSEWRFRGVSATVDGCVVRLGGTAAQPEDVMALAQMISRLPGVERVSVQAANR